MDLDGNAYKCRRGVHRYLCIDKDIDGNRPKEYKLFKYNCWNWTKDTYSKCAKKCGKKNDYDSVYYNIPIIKFPKLPQPIPHNQKPKY